MPRERRKVDAPLVAPPLLPLAPERNHRLRPEAADVGLAPDRALVLLVLERPLRVVRLALDVGHPPEVRVHLGPHRPARVGLAVAARKVGDGRRRLVLEAVAHAPLLGRRRARHEVGDVGALCVRNRRAREREEQSGVRRREGCRRTDRLEAELLKVGLGGLAPAVVDDLALGQHEHLVKLLVDRVAGCTTGSE